MLYSIPTAMLRLQGAASENRCQASVQTVVQKGVTDGMETDSNGLIYYGNVEQESIGIYNPANASIVNFVRDPRVSWIDTSNYCLRFLKIGRR